MTDMAYPSIYVLLGARAAEFPELVELLCRAEAYSRAAAKHDEIAPYIRTWRAQDANRTRRNGRRPNPAHIAPIPTIALHREHEGE